MTTVVDKLPFVDLKAQQKRIRKKLEEGVLRVLDHGEYILGPEVFELEERLKDFVGTKYCISCSNGTDALLMALMALGIGPGDAVFLPAFTFVATAEAVALVGARPVFIDVDERTFNMDPRSLRDVLLSHSPDLGIPKGIIPVDLFGQPADYLELSQIATEFNLFLISDAAQSFGGVYHGKRTCAFGDIATTSFFPAKPLGCYGDGGAIFCNDDLIAEKLLSIRVHGQGKHKYENIRLGINGRLDTIQAAVLIAKLEILEEELKARENIAERYSLRLEGGVVTPFIKPKRNSAWAQYSVLSPQRDLIIKKLSSVGIPTAIYYPLPLHVQEAFKYLGYRAGSLPVTERLCNEIFSLPMHPYLDELTQGRIVESVLGSIND